MKNMVQSALAERVKSDKAKREETLQKKIKDNK